MIDESMDKEQMSPTSTAMGVSIKTSLATINIMIGGVVVNLILGMVIYIFIVFNYGEEQIASEDLKLGMAIHPYLEQYGLQSGDNILEIDGEKVMHYNDIARGLIIRGQKTIGVQHANGSMEEIVLPEDIDYNYLNLVLHMLLTCVINQLKLEH
jgi:regulator of sigma E protease